MAQDIFTLFCKVLGHGQQHPGVLVRTQIRFIPFKCVFGTRQKEHTHTLQHV